MINQGRQELELEALADSILRNDRKNGNHCSSYIDLLKDRDARRRELRRHALITRNLTVLEVFMLQTLSPEDELIRKEEQINASEMLNRVLSRLAQDKTATSIVFVIISEDLSFSKTKEIAEACQLNEEVVRAAKERLKYHARASENLQEVA